MTGIVVVSGGMDSVTLAHDLAEEHAVHLVSFDYGQRHSRELDYARECAARLGAPWTLVDLAALGPSILAGSALTTPSVAVPEGHYAAESMRATVVPNRNAIMLAIATGLAVSTGADFVATAVHAGDHFIYPDCRPGFVAAFDEAMRLANEGFAAEDFHVFAPYVTWTKADIVKRGAAVGVDFRNTWSCYVGGTVHCGACGTCVERREAFNLAEVTDPTVYAEVAA